MKATHGQEYGGVAPQFDGKLLLKCRAQVVRRGQRLNNSALWLPALSRRSRRPATFRPSFVELDKFCFGAPDAIRGAVMVPSHHFSLVPPGELKKPPPPDGGFFLADGRREPVCNDPVTGLD